MCGLLGLLAHVFKEVSVFMVKHFGEEVNLLRVNLRVHIQQPMDAAYLLREFTHCKFGLNCYHVSFCPLQIRCGKVHRVKPKG